MLSRIIVFIIVSFRVVLFLVLALVYFITHPSEWFPRPETSIVPPCLNDPAYGKHCYISVNGIQLHYVISGPEDGPLILMLHGVFEFWYSWRFQIKEFSRNYRVVALDLPGYGYSEKPKEYTHYSISQLTSDVTDFIAALGHNKCILIGQSLGAVIGWNAVRSRPDLFSHFVVLAGTDSTAVRQSRFSIRTKCKFWFLYAFRLPWIPEYMIRRNRFQSITYMYRSKWDGLTNQENMTGEDLDAHLAMFKQEYALTPVFNFYRCNIPSRVVPNRERITVPTLILWAENDRILTKEIAEECTTTVNRFELRYLPCSHWVQQDMPRDVNESIRNFLAAI